MGDEHPAYTPVGVRHTLPVDYWTEQSPKGVGASHYEKYFFLVLDFSCIAVRLY